MGEFWSIVGNNVWKGNVRLEKRVRMEVMEKELGWMLEIVLGLRLCFVIYKLCDVGYMIGLF